MQLKLENHIKFVFVFLISIKNWSSYSYRTLTHQYYSERYIFFFLDLWGGGDILGGLLNMEGHERGGDQISFHWEDIFSFNWGISKYQFLISI